MGTKEIINWQNNTEKLPSVGFSLICLCCGAIIYIKKYDLVTSIGLVAGIFTILFSFFDKRFSCLYDQPYVWGFIVLMGSFIIVSDIKGRVILPQKEETIFIVEQQRQFDDLVAKYDNRMQQKLTYYNAYELITEDYALLKQILQMLNDTHDLKTDSRNDYKEKFQKRADTAVSRIDKVIYGTYENVITPLEDSIYKVQKDSIESMKKESYRL